MALSRIWSAFIIIAVIVALFRMAGGDKDIFNRMVVGKASDPYDSVYYTTIGSPQSQKLSSNYFAFLREYGYTKSDSAHRATVLLTDNLESDSVKMVKAMNPGIAVYTYVSVQSRLQRKADGIIQTAKSAVIDIIIPLIGIMAMFMGFLSIAEQAGGVRLLSRMIYPFFSKVFPDIPKGHPAIGHMMMNFSANLLNLDNAATPFGLKAIESLQELNPNKAVASNAQIMFLALHASGLTLIPVTIIAYRSGLGAKNPTDIFIPCMIATFVATMAALFIVSFKQKIKLLQPVILAWVLGISALIALLVWYVRCLDPAHAHTFHNLLTHPNSLLIILAIISCGLSKKID